ncbi:MAG TPA: hypothetical protein PKA63_11990 [Oligoflexia bacterium]|nr:hypothetical protein [Oligoflexia bacterium]HMP49375.1 hypothetical protein [Oligoflexia bacterium]
MTAGNTLCKVALDVTSLAHPSQIFEKVRESWIPTQKVVVDEILAKIYAGFYEDSFSLFTQDLKKDMALYLFIYPAINTECFSDLNDYRKTGHKRFQTKLPEITHLLHQAKKRFSDKKSLHDTKFQSELLKEAVLSAEIVSCLSEKCGIKSELGYLLASLKYLGRTLLAWNYPKEFSQALHIMKTKSIEASLDTILSNIFGFSPSTLAAKVALEIGLEKEVCEFIGSPSGGDTSKISTSPNRKSLDKLGKICKLGEALAMAHSTIQHPVEEQDITQVIKLIEDQLGKNALNTIYKKTASLLKEKEETNSFLTSGSAVKELVSEKNKITNRVELIRLAKLANLPEETAHTIIRETLDRNTTKEVIRDIFYQMLPAQGIISSLVFVENPLEASLTPVFKKGTTSFIKASPVTLINSSINNQREQRHIIREVFYQKNCWLGEGISLDGDDSVYILAPIPDKNPIGVLYLEGKKDQISAENMEFLGKFTSKCFSYLYSSK